MCVGFLREATKWDCNRYCAVCVIAGRVRYWWRWLTRGIARLLGRYMGSNLRLEGACYVRLWIWDE